LIHIYHFWSRRAESQLFLHLPRWSSHLCYCWQVGDEVNIPTNSCFSMWELDTCMFTYQICCSFWYATHKMPDLKMYTRKHGSLLTHVIIGSAGLKTISGSMMGGMKEDLQEIILFANLLKPPLSRHKFTRANPFSHHCGTCLINNLTHKPFYCCCWRCS
jgi:hypothetical protein